MPDTRPALAVVHFDASRAGTILEEVTRLLDEVHALLDEQRSIFEFLRELIDRRTPVDNMLLISPAFFKSGSLQSFGQIRYHRREPGECTDFG